MAVCHPWDGMILGEEARHAAWIPAEGSRVELYRPAAMRGEETAPRMGSPFRSGFWEALVLVLGLGSLSGSVLSKGLNSLAPINFRAPLIYRIFKKSLCKIDILFFFYGSHLFQRILSYRK
jgi:hypothetical protein